MKRPNDPPDIEPPRPKLSRLEEEARRVINDYIEDLKEIINKLRQRLN